MKFSTPWYFCSPPKKLQEDSVFSRACHSLWGGGVAIWSLPMMHWNTTYRNSTPALTPVTSTYGRPTDDTDPTGILSCYLLIMASSSEGSRNLLWGHDIACSWDAKHILILLFLLFDRKFPTQTNGLDQNNVWSHNKLAPRGPWTRRIPVRQRNDGINIFKH